MSNIQKFTLDNGVRVLCESIDTVRSAAVGITCHTGSRHENDDEAGITHFIEHMLFKGTERRGSREIAESIEGRGGVLNAFTDKEQTTYYARVLSDDVENSIDVLTDMLLHSTLAEEELEREKGVVIEEISRSEDEPGDHVHDLHMRGQWGDHPLGKPVIGTKESVRSFSRQNLVDYLARRYRGGELILSATGDIKPEAILRLAEKFFASVTPGADQPVLEAPQQIPGENLIQKDIEQVHFCLGGPSVDYYHDDIYAVAVLDSILGGGMSSRLFYEIRERRGLAYSVGSYNVSYSAGGLFTIYGGTSLATWEEVLAVTHAEIKKIVDDGLVPGELERIKRQMSGHMVLALEGMNSRMMRMTKNELRFGRDIPVDETLARVNAVDEAKVRELAATMLAPEVLRVTALGPFGG